MENSNLKSKTIKSLAWRFAERCGAQGVAFIVSIILARIIEPSAYGTIALMTVFITILNVFIDSGMGNAIVQKKDADELDYSTVFVFNLIMCLVLYLGLFFSAPLVAGFYKDETMVWPLRCLGLTLIIAGFKSIQQAYVSRHLLFKRFFFSTLGGTIGAAVIGIVMAYKGFGVWALVCQQVFNSFVDMMILFITVRWRPKCKFSFQRFRELFSFGWKLLASALINTVYNDIRQLIIGKMYSTRDLAFYNKGKSFPNLIVANIDTSIDSVLLPVMSSVQDKKESIKAMTRRAVKTSSYIMWPMMFGVMAIAKPMITILLTEKWLFCVPYLRIFCFTYGLMPIHTANLNAIKAMGRSDMFLRLEVIKKVYGAIILLITIPFGVLAMAYSHLFAGVISSFVNASPNKRLMDYSYVEQVKDILPSFLLAAFMAVVIMLVGMLKVNIYALLAVQVVIGAAIYIGGSALLKLDTFSYIKELVASKMKHN